MNKIKNSTKFNESFKKIISSPLDIAKNFKLYLFIHIFLGLIFTIWNFFINIWFLIFLSYAILHLIYTKDRYNSIPLIIGYSLFFEVILILNKHFGNLSINWNIIKLTSILFLSMGIYFSKKTNLKKIIFLIPPLLLIPSFYFTYIKQELLSNMINKNLLLEFWAYIIIYEFSAYLVLSLAIIYFYNKKIDFKIFNDLTLIFFITSIITIILTIFNINQIYKNGFIPSYVSLLLCSSILMIISYYIFNSNIRHKILIIFSVFFLLVSVYLKSSGEVSSLIIGLIISMIYLTISIILKKNNTYKRIISKKILLILILFISITTIMMIFQTNQFNQYIAIIKDPLYPREKYIKADLEIFENNLIFGTGIGTSKLSYSQNGMNIKYPHLEISNLFHENGIFGGAIILFLIILPLSKFIKENNIFDKYILILLPIFVLLNLLQNVMTFAIFGFLYGFAFSYIDVKKA